jgi:hypothetical protein
MPPTPGAGAWRDARLVRAHVGGTRGLVFGADRRGNRERCVGQMCGPVAYFIIANYRFRFEVEVERKL